MRQKIRTRDPIAVYRRKTVAARRIGLDVACSCGESRPEALVAGSQPIICAGCLRSANGRSTLDMHHPFGRANSPVTISVPVNDHRARLSVDQADWPKSTLMNAEGSPLLAAAAGIRGFMDTVLYLIEHGLLWIADMLEWLHDFLVKKLGPKYWFHTGFEQYAPAGKRNHANS